MQLENPTMRSIMAEALHSVSVLSQMQYNFGERLSEMSEAHTQLYEEVKKTKDHFIEALENTYPRELGRNARDGEKRVCKGLHDMVDRLEEDEITRIQKIRENCIIFYTMSKQICEKQRDEVASNGARLSKLEIESTRRDLTKLVNDVADLHNSLLGPDDPRIDKKQDKMAQSMRNSLRMTRNNSAADLKRERSKNALKEIERACEDAEKQVIAELNDKYLSRKGLLSKDMARYAQLSYFVRPQLVSSFAYSLLESFNFARLSEPETKASLTSIKVRLRLGDNGKLTFNQTRSFKEYIQLEMDGRPEPERRCILHLASLSQYHSHALTEDQLLAALEKHSAGPCTTGELPAPDFEFDVWVAAVLVEVLLETLFRAREGEEFLIDSYADIFGMVAAFGKQYLGVESQLTLAMFLGRVFRDSEFRDANELQPNVRALDKLMEIEEFDPERLSDLAFFMRGELRNALCQKLLDVYLPNTHTELVVQMLQWLDIYFKTNVALETIFSCLQLSGYRYLRSKDPDRSLFGVMWENKEKARILSDTVRNNEFLLIDEKILQPLAKHIASLYGIAADNVKKRVREAFFHTISQVILENTKTIDMTGLEDKDGHLLRLGIELCKVDQFAPQSLISYSSYFELLAVALAGMEAEYKDLLEQTKTTEVWALEQDMYATQNCHDFCSLLAKPIEFMAGILKETVLIDGADSEFRTRFVRVVKLKLNEILKSEVVKYFAFLESSLKRVAAAEPRVQLEGRKVESPPPHPTAEELRQSELSFREYCRRLNNLLFVKQQINSIVRDTLDDELQLQIGDIFDRPQIEAEIAKASEAHRELLLILRKIAEDIVAIEQRVVEKLAKSLVYFYLRRFFDRLYHRPEKGTFEELFGNSSDVKLSEHTMMSAKEELEAFVELIRRSVPAEYLEPFCALFFRALHQGTQLLTQPPSARS